MASDAVEREHVKINLARRNSLVGFYEDGIPIDSRVGRIVSGPVIIKDETCFLKAGKEREMITSVIKTVVAKGDRITIIVRNPIGHKKNV